MEELDGITTATFDIATGVSLDGTTAINNISSGSISTTGYSSNISWDKPLGLTNEQKLDHLIKSISSLDDAINLLRVQVSSLSKEIKKEKFNKRTLIKK